jgi:hypothetical protein
MPAFITNNSSEPDNGLINILDIKRLLKDYADIVQLYSSDTGRNPVHKYLAFDIQLSKIQEIVNNNSTAKPGVFRVNLVLNLPGQKDCDQAQIQNFLSILVCGIDGSDNALLNVEDAVLVEGFKDKNENAIQSPECCVRTIPPTS